MTQVGGNHYQADEIRIEPFEVIDAWSEKWPSGTEFYLGSALKYIARCGVKNDGEDARTDLLKAAHYLTEAANRVAGPQPGDQPEAPSDAFGVKVERPFWAPGSERESFAEFQKRAIVEESKRVPGMQDQHGQPVWYTSPDADSRPIAVPNEYVPMVEHFLRLKEENPAAKVLVALGPADRREPEGVAEDWERVREEMQFTPEEDAEIDRRRRRHLAAQAQDRWERLNASGTVAVDDNENAWRSFWARHRNV